jgi:hypothetical protein
LQQYIKNDNTEPDFFIEPSKEQIDRITMPKGIRTDYEKDVKDMNEEGKLFGYSFCRAPGVRMSAKL